jgi:hypothetical protein
MRAALLLVLVSTAVVHSPIRAQTPGLELSAGLGYARVFDAGGVSLAAALDRSLSPSQHPLQQALGGSLWYAHTGIASAPDDPEGRDLVGVGVRYQLALRPSRFFNPFLAVPVQLLHSHIADRAQLLSAALGSAGVPEAPPSRPVEDKVGGAWGWGTGLELGFRLGGATKRLNAHTSVQLLYQDIYDAGTRNGAWNWHAGLSYALHGS